MSGSAYQDFKELILALVPRVAVLSERDWHIEGAPSANQWMMRVRGVDYDTARKYSDARAWRQKEVDPNKTEPKEVKPRGRPKGSKNKPKRPEPSKRGRPRKS